MRPLARVLPLLATSPSSPQAPPRQHAARILGTRVEVLGSLCQRGMQDHTNGIAFPNFGGVTLEKYTNKDPSRWAVMSCEDDAARILRQNGCETSEDDKKKIPGMWFSRKYYAWWEKRFEELKDYKARLKSCNVPQRWDENPKLGTWVSKQREQYWLLKQGRKSYMTTERVEKLESIGFEWVLRERTSWEDRFEELQDYKACFRDCNVPTKWKENVQLGVWVHTQRTQYRLLKEGKKSHMTPERIEKLENIGLEWSLDPWKDRFEELKDYKARFGNCNVPQKWKENPQLGSWVSTQRTHYWLLQEGKKSTVTTERIEQLESIGFAWSLW